MIVHPSPNHPPSDGEIAPESVGPGGRESPACDLRWRPVLIRRSWVRTRTSSRAVESGIVDVVVGEPVESSRWAA
jgi:hypothetical protein